MEVVGNSPFLGDPENATFGVNVSRAIPLLTFTNVNNNSILKKKLELNI